MVQYSRHIDYMVFGSVQGRLRITALVMNKKGAHQLVMLVMTVMPCIQAALLLYGEKRTLPLNKHIPLA